MNIKRVSFFVALIVVIGAVVWFFVASYPRPLPQTNITHDPQPMPSNVSTNTISNGALSFSYDPHVWGLATNREQILVKSYIPPCLSEKFDYCLYYMGDSYKGTNFESAGVDISIRSDLTTKDKCMAPSADGYVDASSQIKEVSGSNGYTIKTIGPVGDAATGHYSNGTVYYVYIGGGCYRFRMQIGQTRYENYSEGIIKRFTTEDEKAVNATMLALLHDMTFNGKHVDFPPASSVPQAM